MGKLFRFALRTATQLHREHQRAQRRQAYEAQFKLNRLQPRHNNFQSVLEAINDQHHSTAHRGRAFEELVAKWMLHSPELNGRFVDAKLWGELGKGTDIGIDVVGWEQGGGMCAVQCKFYAPTSSIAKKDVSALIAASAGYGSRMLVHTAGRITRNAKSVMKHQQPPVEVISAPTLGNSAMNWAEVLGFAP